MFIQVSFHGIVEMTKDTNSHLQNMLRKAFKSLENRFITISQYSD